MRFSRPRPTIRRLMIVVAAMAIGSAMLVPRFGPMFAPRPRIAVASPVLTIGNFPFRTEGRQAWTVRNTGDAPLLLWMLDQSDCSMAPCVFESASTVQADGSRWSTSQGGRTPERIIVGPGGSATIAMSWKSREHPGIVENDLDFGTNDPKQPRLRLTLMLDVVASATAPGAGDATIRANPR